MNQESIDRSESRSDNVDTCCRKWRGTIRDVMTQTVFDTKSLVALCGGWVPVDPADQLM